MVPFPVRGKLCIPAHPNPFLLSDISRRLSPFPFASFVTKNLPVLKKDFVVPCVFLSNVTCPFHRAAQACPSCIPALPSSFIFRAVMQELAEDNLCSPKQEAFFC